MTGGQYNFIGPDGNNIELEIKSGTQHNDLIVLDKQGLFNKKTNRRGNLHIFVNVEVPSLDTQEDLENIIKRLKNK
jgi:DnaJ-class molecular chaperone